MKVCFLTTIFPLHFGDILHGSFVYQLAKCLIRNGVEISVVAPDDSTARTQEILDGVLVRRFTYFLPRRLQRVAYRWGIPENLRNNWTIALQLPMFMASFAWAALTCARTCDVIHAHWIPSGLVGLFVSKLIRKPLIVTVWGTDIRALPAWMSKMVLKNADKVISLSLEIQERIQVLGVQAISILSPIDEDRFNPQINGSSIITEFGLDRTHHVVSFIARLYEFKDPITYVEAIPLVLKKKKNVKFFLVGDGKLRPKLEQMISHLNLHGHVFLTGARSDVNQILAVSDIFITISPVENLWSTTISEATYMQVPCILTDAGHTGEVFTHGKNCYLIPPRSPSALAAAIISLLENPSLRSSLAEQACYLHQEHGHNDSQIAARHIDIYRTALNKS